MFLLIEIFSSIKKGKQSSCVSLLIETFSSINVYAIYARIDRELQIKEREIIQFINRNFFVDQFLCISIQGKKIIQLRIFID